MSAITKAKKQTKTAQYKVKQKVDNKSIALNTSKINYNDPRISVAWCKKFEVPIEKIFPSSVRKKFPWAVIFI